ncbi:MAG TPA: PH domain-containing protein [Methylomirabilota bacterium]|nr:PH domain-containing protein [Methylomirabilota bacterium]
MGYVEQNLMPGEEITYRTHLHWVIYAGPLLVGALGVLLLLCSVYWAGLPLASLGGLLLLAAAGLAVGRWIVARTSEFAVTNKRVIIKRGLVRRHTLELLLTKVESIGVDQGIAARLFGYGSIVVIGTGGTRESFDNIARPLEFRKQVQAQAAA